MLGEKLGLTVEELRDLEVAALVHDLGKIRIPDNVLKKAGPLDEDEMQLVKCHTSTARNPWSFTGAAQVHPSCSHHHEWYNGQGYPKG